MTRDQFISLFFIALFGLVVYQICLIFSPFLRAIFWSGTLAFAFYPLHLKLKNALQPHSTLPAILMTAGIFLIVVPPVAFIMMNLIEQAVGLYQSTSTFVREGGLEKLIEQIRSLRIIQRIETHVFQWEPLKQTATSWLLSGTRSIGNIAAVQAQTLTKNFFLVGLNTFLMTVLLFVFLKDGEKIYRFIYDITPLENKTKKALFNQVNETFAAVIRGQLLTSFVQAALAGFIFTVLDLPAPILFAVVTFLVTMIPVVGAVTIWLPFVVYLVTLHGYVKAVILFLFGTFVISLVDNILKPALIGEKTKLPYFMLFFGILGGLKVYGLMGIFVAPVILSLFFSLITIYREKYL